MVVRLFLLLVVGRRRSAVVERVDDNAFRRQMERADQVEADFLFTLILSYLSNFGPLFFAHELSDEGLDAYRTFVFRFNLALKAAVPLAVQIPFLPDVNVIDPQILWNTALRQAKPGTSSCL